MAEFNHEKDSDVKLVGYWMSPFVHRVSWALRLKNIDYEYIHENLLDKSDILSEVNPLYGKVPVLLHGGGSICESSIIIQYIDDVWKHHPFMSTDPLARAQDRVWGKFIDEKVMFSMWFTFCTEEGEKRERIIREVVWALGELDKKLEGMGTKFFGGDNPGYLDLMLGFVSYIMPICEEVASLDNFLDPLKFPTLAAWKDNFINHPVIREEPLPIKEDLIPFFQWRHGNLVPIFTAWLAALKDV